ncbi:CMP-N-acetylneuraminate-beta-galactosamide-alpha-2,3-sialyltransferase 2-like [Orcinus orca]|uniref:CMP-N-acetylneuraminate-beta-galactosamide- alpha-2,3-sialyltransferase 2-like n=1 Tax=Orcinus orca TaxID=9733 RepID=UPI001442A15B|nr:CMP-N-acetylneuraminate-beta-galactosamide-alpha-2,3-sialyltransferase 2-like [Orcinus orca]
MTTVHITYPEIDSPQDPGAQLLLLPLNSSGLKWVMEVSVISLSFLQYVQQRWLGKNDHFPSLGFIALLYALHACDQVSLFGLWTDRLSRWSHYWDEEYWFKSNMHSFKEEQQVIPKLQFEGKVVIYN